MGLQTAVADAGASTRGMTADRQWKGASVAHVVRLVRPGQMGQPYFRIRPRRLTWHDQRMLIAFSVTPLGVGDSVGDLVAEAVRVVRASGLPNQTDAMFTLIEGEWDEVMAVVKQAVDVVAARAPRVSVVLKADVRPGVTDALTSKVATVDERLAAG